MSDNLPIELQTQILKKLPVKSLIQFRSVSKTCKSLIDSTHFISHYSGPATHLLVSNDQDLSPFFYSFTDNHTFPQQKVSITTPQSINHCHQIGCSHGLLCLYCDYHYWPKAGRCFTRMNMAFVWNLSIRKVVAVVVPNVGDGVYKIVLGFGVCRETVDPKIVKIRYVKDEVDIGTITSVPWQVEVFSLSTGAWRSPCKNLPRKSITFTDQHQHVASDGFIYWLASDRITTDPENKTCNLIISFDMTSEEFGEVHFPRCLAHASRNSLYVFKLRGSLVVVEQDVEANNLAFVVWMMGDGVLKSFTKLYSGIVNTPNDAWVLGFRNNGEAIIEVIDDDDDGKLLVYEPYSKHIYNLDFEGMKWSFSVCSYKETLLLLDHPNLTVYNGKTTHKFEDDLLHDQFQLLI